MSQKNCLSNEVQKIIICPKCGGKLLFKENVTVCNGRCSLSYPVIDNIPILIDEENSIFSLDDFLLHKDTTMKLTKNNTFGKIIRRILPRIDLNSKAKDNYNKFGKLLLEETNNPIVLVTGGGIVGKGLDSLLSNTSIKFIESDVSFGPRTTLICDAHSLPFEQNSIDGVIIQAVLEHVVDPYRCVEEIHRVLKPNGLVYAETPFMQQVHMGAYDFTRFTHLGHRRLFRKFDEIESGAVCGTGMALANSYKNFLCSFTENKFLIKLIMLFSRFTAFFLKYFDYITINKSVTLDAASGYYFMGRKSDKVLSDRQLIKLYKGAL